MKRKTWGNTIRGWYSSIELDLRQIPRPHLAIQSDGEARWLYFDLTAPYSDAVLAFEIGRAR